MLIEPAQLHMHLEVLSSIGCEPSKTVGAPGIQGEDVAGIQGIGVSTPSAAAVADATVGFAGEMHMPNGIMFAIGLWSMMLAATCELTVTLLTGGTMRADGAIPIVHISCAVITVA